MKCRDVKKSHFAQALGNQDHRNNAKHTSHSINEYRSQGVKTLHFSQTLPCNSIKPTALAWNWNRKKNSLLVKLPVKRANSSKLGKSVPASNSHTQGRGETAVFPRQLLLWFWTWASSSLGGRRPQKALRVSNWLPQKQPMLSPLHINFSRCRCCSTPCPQLPPAQLYSPLGQPAPLTLSDTSPSSTSPLHCLTSATFPPQALPNVAPNPCNALIHPGGTLPFYIFADDDPFFFSAALKKRNEIVDSTKIMYFSKRSMYLVDGTSKYIPCPHLWCFKFREFSQYPSHPCPITSPTDQSTQHVVQHWEWGAEKFSTSFSSVWITRLLQT